MFEISFVQKAFLLGVGATIVMDVWAFILRRVFKLASLDMRMVGRWAGLMLQGHFWHAHIAKAAPVAGERALGWFLHYLIGVIFAGAFLTLVPVNWIDNPTPILAVLFGIGTLIFPFFVMQPAFGFGIAASRTPTPNTARLKSLFSHMVFGVGIYLAAITWNWGLKLFSA